eukprot:768567-Hanusia_phi.AAC.1
MFEKDHPYQSARIELLQSLNLSIILALEERSEGGDDSMSIVLLKGFIELHGPGQLMDSWENVLDGIAVLLREI